MQETAAYQITDGTGRYVGRYIGQTVGGAVLAATRITTLLPPLGATTVTVDGVYEVTANTIHTVSPTSPLYGISLRYYLFDNCVGQGWVPDGAIDFAPFIVWGDADQRVYVVGAGGGITVRSQQNPDGSCSAGLNLSRQGRPLTATGITGIVDRYNALNPTFVPVFDVGALFVP